MLWEWFILTLVAVISLLNTMTHFFAFTESRLTTLSTKWRLRCPRGSTVQLDPSKAAVGLAVVVRGMSMRLCRSLLLGTHVEMGHQSCKHRRYESTRRNTFLPTAMRSVISTSFCIH